MRDHFDPLAVVYQNQHHELERPLCHSRSSSSSGTMQDQGQKRRHFHSTSRSTQEHCNSNNGRFSPNNPFDAGFSQSQSTSFSPASSNDAFAAVVVAGVGVVPSQHLVATGPTTGASTTPTSTNVSSHHGSSNYSSNANLPGMKRNSSNDEFLDCNVLQSSLKRVRLSRCPGEFRLQSDLETLDSKLWSSRSNNATSTSSGVGARSNAINFSSTTWIHQSTGARLTMVDSLRICLFLPMTVMASGDSNWNSNLNSNSSTNGVIVDPRPRAHPQDNKHCSYHRDYRWRIMIQIPRMYPHQPPVVTRIEGLSLESIAINERPQQPHAHAHVHQDYRNHRSPNPDPTSSLFFTEEQVARSHLHSQSSGTMNTSTNTNATDDTANTHHTSTTAVEWNNWSAVAGLGELLEFMVGAAASNLSTSTFPTTTTTASTKSIFAMSVAARASSSSSLSSVSSSSSSSCTDPPSSFWSRANTNNTNSRQHNNNNHAVTNNPSSFFVGNNHVTNTAMMSEETATSSSNGTNISGASFLLPNRFDIGYGRSNNGYEKYNQNPTTFAGAGGNAGGGGSTQQHNHRHRDHHQLQYREKQCEDDDVDMDMS